MNKMSIRKDDLVVVLSGKDKGKQGKVLEVMPKSGKVVVEKINVVSRHTKPRKQGEQGGIIKKDGLGVVLSGKDKGKQGKVLEVMPKDGKVIVEKINMVSRHTKPRKQGDQGGILQKEAPLYACKVQKVCPKCNKPTRIGHKVEGDKKVRICKKCGAEI